MAALVPNAEGVWQFAQDACVTTTMFAYTTSVDAQEGLEPKPLQNYVEGVWSPPLQPKSRAAAIETFRFWETEYCAEEPSTAKLKNMDKV